MVLMAENVKSPLEPIYKEYIENGFKKIEIDFRNAKGEIDLEDPIKLEIDKVHKAMNRIRGERLKMYILDDNVIRVDGRFKDELFILNDKIDEKIITEKLIKLWEEYYRKVFNDYVVNIHVDRDEKVIKFRVSVYIKHGDKLVFADSDVFRIIDYWTYYVNKDVLAGLLKEFGIIVYPDKLDL
jgi:hypothetical protein